MRFRRTNVRANIGALVLTVALCAAQLAASEAREPAVRDLFAADSAWSAHWRSFGFMQAFSDVATSDVFYLTAGQPILRGPRSVSQLLASDAARVPTPARLLPVKAGVSADGTLGYTCGHTVMSGDSPATNDRHGKYLAVWRHVADRWRLAALVLTTDAAPSTAGTMIPAMTPLVDSPLVGASMRESAEAARARAMQTDSAFSARASSTSIAEAFAWFAAQNAVSLSGQAIPVGPQAIGATFKDVAPSVRMTWAPIDGGAAQSGDLAFTVGEVTTTIPATASAPARAGYSKYVTVWQKQSNGEWRYVADGGNNRPAPVGAAGSL